MKIKPIDQLRRPSMIVLRDPQQLTQVVQPEVKAFLLSTFS